MSLARMSRIALCSTLLVSGLSLPVAFAAPAAAPVAPVAAGDDPLAAKGLSKTGPVYTLKSEKEIGDGFKTLAGIKKKMDDEAKARNAIDKNITTAKNAYSQWDQERRGYLEKLATVKDAFQNNQLIAKIEALQSKMKEAIDYKDQQEKKLREVGDSSRTEYVNKVLDLSTQADKAVADYAEINKDQALAAAAAAQKAKLGPSAEFTGMLAQLKRLKGPITSEVIKVDMEGQVPMVEVTLNGSTIKKMVFDSGSSTICIPADLAKAMELVPAKTDPEIQLQLADGKLVTARRTILKSVRVGQFTVENVECAVLPPDLIAAQPLLGGSFLNQFIYKLDTAKGELHLAKIGGDGKPEVKKPGAK